MQDKNKQHEEIIILQKLTLTPDSLAALREDDFFKHHGCYVVKGVPGDVYEFYWYLNNLTDCF